jgi:predicted unusual protein kinase regulating ubiquinone biosynthesis (AarF/ABC1/UbiB family)
MRLLESNQNSIRAPQTRDTGDSLHAAFQIVQELAVNGHPVPLNLLLLRKSFLTLDGICRQLDPDFSAWRENVAYASEVFASEAAVRAWSIPLPWLDRPAFYRSGLSTRLLATELTRAMAKKLCVCKKFV